MNTTHWTGGPNDTAEQNWDDYADDMERADRRAAILAEDEDAEREYERMLAEHAETCSCPTGGPETTDECPAFAGARKQAVPTPADPGRTVRLAVPAESMSSLVYGQEVA